MVCAVAVWPCSDLVGQFREATASSAQGAYYQPLLNELGRERAGLSLQAQGQRVELVDTANHWGTYYLDSLPLARGWDRQADVGDNQIFYDQGRLTPASYRAWLNELAVRWVVVPAAQLDYASVDEAKLISRGLGYLQPVWSSDDWKLYQVVDPAPLVRGATLVGVTSNDIAVQTTGPTTVAIRMRWSPYVHLGTLGSGQVAAGCVQDHDGWIDVVAPRAETFTLTSRFTATARFASASRC